MNGDELIQQLNEARLAEAVDHRDKLLRLLIWELKEVKLRWISKHGMT